VNAIHAQMIVMIVVGFGLGFWLGPLTEYFLIALTFTFALILIYSAGNLGVFLYHFRERRQEFNWLLHAVFPAVSTAGLLTVGYFSAVPLPPAPITYAPVVLVVWILVGIGVLVYFKSTGREQWIAKAIQSANERVETAEELAHRPGI
jgi:amino acid transporter